MINEGTYTATVKDHGIAFSSQKGTPEVYVEFDIDGQSVFGDFWITEGAIDRTIEQLQLLGFDGNEFEPLNDEPGILIGNQAKVRVVHESYVNEEGTERITARVAWVNDPDYQARKRAENVDATVSRFNALLATKQAAAASGDGDKPF
jgi:hypothetical protein